MWPQLTEGRANGVLLREGRGKVARLCVAVPRRRQLSPKARYTSQRFLANQNDPLTFPRNQEGGDQIGGKV